MAQQSQQCLWSAGTQVPSRLGTAWIWSLAQELLMLMDKTKKNNNSSNSYIKFPLFNLLCGIYLLAGPRLLQTRKRGHGKAEDCPPWSGKQVDKAGGWEGKWRKRGWGRREWKQESWVSAFPWEQKLGRHVLEIRATQAVEILDSRTLLWEDVVAHTLTNAWQLLFFFLMKLKIWIFYDPEISILGIYPREMKTCLQKDLYRTVQNSFFITGLNWK